MGNRYILRLENISKTYTLGHIQIPVLKNISLAIEEGTHISLMGPSGSGKTTLLNILGCLDRPTGGKYYIDGKEVSSLNDDELSEVRSKKIGFIFQSYNLIPHLTVIENIGLPLFYQGLDEETITHKAIEMAEIVGLGNRIRHKPSELSGGQQQRVAIARALINNPAFILADEPTGNLDTKTGKEIMELLKKLNEEQKTTLFIVTHDSNIASYGKLTVRILDGEIVNG
ncbi:MAG TPA: ABC transporter ATP-binding protein [bacterium]|nr:ABC transporter ATP-binding protein [bacterium]HPP29457.1 ABC transporter ATP-binding protein [bacterium]